jgi:hypothetical protein
VAISFYGSVCWELEKMLQKQGAIFFLSAKEEKNRTGSRYKHSSSQAAP